MEPISLHMVKDKLESWEYNGIKQWIRTPNIFLSQKKSVEWDDPNKTKNYIKPMFIS